MMECGIIRDLLPSYIDELTGEESNHAIEEHLSECAECREYLEAMKAELASEKHIEINKAQAKADIRVFKKLRKRTGDMICVTGFIIVFLCAVYESYFLSGKSAMSKDVEITYENTDGIVRLGFVSKKDNIELLGGHLETDDNPLDEDGPTEELIPIVYHVNPLKDLVDYKWTWDKEADINFAFLDDGTVIYVKGDGDMVRLKGDEQLCIEFADKTTEAITVNDLRTEAGAQKLRQ